MAAPLDEDGIAPATNDAYTGMLTTSLIALLVACALLYLDYSQYGDKAPPAVQVVPPDQKLSTNPLLKAKEANKDFHVVPATIELVQGKERKVAVKNGKALDCEIDPKEGLKVDVAEKEITITAAENAEEQLYTVTVKGENDKTAILKVNVKKLKE